MNKLIIELPTTIRQCLLHLSKNGQGILFLTHNSKLQGSLSDGDIRRALLNGFSLEDNVETIINRDVKTLSNLASPIEVHRAFSHGIEFVPLVNAGGLVEKIIRVNDHSLIPLSEPNLSFLETEYLNDAMSSGWISSAGNYVEMFEKTFANYVGSKNAISVSNGTLGLVLALKMLKIGIGDEVIVPNLTFGATANAVCQVGATPIFVDVTRETLCIDTKNLKKSISKKTRAIIPVHLYGNAADMVEIQNIAKEFKLFVIEDAAEAIGTRISGKHVGTFGDIGVFSFYANKTITTGEGGMIVFNDEKLLSTGKMMRSHGFSPSKRYWHETWGTNMRITNLQAAIGCAQMERVDEFVRIKQQNAIIYKDLLKHLCPANLVFLEENLAVENSHWLFVIKLKNDMLTALLESYLKEHQIETRRIFYPLNIQPAFEKYDSKRIKYTASTEAFASGLCLPSSTLLSIDQIQKITFHISNFFNNLTSK